MREVVGPAINTVNTYDGFLFFFLFSTATFGWTYKSRRFYILGLGSDTSRTLAVPVQKKEL
jgi:hypothetical protein